MQYIRFGSVCTSWASAASPLDGLCLPLAPRMSFLLLPGKYGLLGDSAPSSPFSPTSASSTPSITTASVTAIADIIYHDGKFLATSRSGELWSFDLTGPSPEMTKITDGWDYRYSKYDKFLVESSGDLLQVLKWSNAKTMKVFKFDPEHAAWILLYSLGDKSIFLGL